MDQPSAAAPTGDARPTRIVLIGGSPPENRWIQAATRGTEFAVAGEASGPDEPPRFVGDRAPDVVIVHAADGASGTECVRRLRAMRLDAPILLLSAHRSRGLNEQARESGAQGTVLKTGSVAELLGALRALVRGDSSFDRNHPARPGAQSVLSRREREVLQLVARGATNREIAEALGIGSETVKTVLARTSAKLGVRGRNKTATAAHGLGLL